MSAITNGGPAFPQSDLTAYGIGHEEGNNGGMSLRDWFAGQALAGLLAFPGTVSGDREKSPSPCAEVAFAMADAMLAARAEAKP